MCCSQECHVKLSPGDDGEVMAKRADELAACTFRVVSFCFCCACIVDDGSTSASLQNHCEICRSWVSMIF